MKPANLTKLWKEIRNTGHVYLTYLPDAFLKKPPPRKFFLKIIYAIDRQVYSKMKREIDELLTKKTAGASDVFYKPSWVVEMSQKYNRVDNPVNRSIFKSQKAYSIFCSHRSGQKRHQQNQQGKGFSKPASLNKRLNSETLFIFKTLVINFMNILFD